MNDTDKPTVEVNLQKLLVASGGVLPKRLFVVKEGEGTKNIEIHHKHSEAGWKITLVDTGLNTMTGSRVKRIERFIDGDIFMLTYGDGVTDLNIQELLNFHKSHGKTGTITGVTPPSRYGELSIHKDQVTSFMEITKSNCSGS